MKTSRILCILAVLATSTCFGDQITIDMDSGISGTHKMFDHLTTLLSGGSTLDGNGTVMQLGYFSTSSISNNFAGTWIPLSGETSANNGGSISGATPSETFNKTSIGDLNINGAGNGSFALSLTFVVGNAGTGNSLPSATTIPLSIRFYDGTSIASSSFYNTVSDDLWLWKTPSTPAPTNISISLDDSGLEWQSIVVSGQASTTAFHTSIATVPEPSTFACVGFGFVTLALFRRFRRA